MKFTINSTLRCCMWLLLYCLLPTYQAIAQTGSGTSTLDNGYRYTAAGDTTFEYAETLYIGPNAVWNISGTHVIYSKYIWIAPSAQIENNSVGKIIIADPNENPFYPDMTGPTTIDGNNGNPVGAIILHNSPENIILNDIADPGFATTNPSGALAASLHLGNDFVFGIDNGDIILNGNDLVFSGAGSFTGYNANRMIVTGNSIAGHLVRINNGSTATVVFPIGIAEGDYTPVTINGDGDYHISVTDYSSSGAVINVPQEGMNRAWHLFGDAANSVTLQHNSPATDGTLYTDALAFVTRYQGNAAWSSGIPEQTAAGIHVNAGTIAAGIPALGSDAGAWLSKSSEPITPLPITLASFEVIKVSNTPKLIWVTSREQNNKGFEIERSFDGRSWTKIGFVNSLALNGNSQVKLSYEFMDQTAAMGNNYYRLKQIDADGSYKHSRIKSIYIGAGNDITMRPNPVEGNLIISGLKGLSDIEWINASGQTVRTLKSVSASSVQVDMSGLPAGVYFIRITDNTGKRTVYKMLRK